MLPRLIVCRFIIIYNVTSHSVPKRFTAMNLALNIVIVADREQSMRRCHFRFAVKFGAVGAQQFPAVDTLDRRRRLPRLVDALSAISILIQHNAHRAANLAHAAAARLGSDCWSATPDDVG